MSESLAILVIEDSEDAARNLIQSLQQSNVSLRWQRVWTAEALRSALISQNWDVVLSGYCLSQIDVWAGLSIVKQLQPSLPFIVVSEPIAEASIVRIIKAGAQNYVSTANLFHLLTVVQEEVEGVCQQHSQRSPEPTFSQTKEQIELAIEGANIGTWTWNIQTGEVQINTSCAELIGGSLPDKNLLQIATWQQLTHPNDLPMKTKTLNRHLQGETSSYECEFRMRHGLEHWIWVLDRGKVVEWDADGKPIRMAGTYLNISDRKQVERRLALQSQILNQIANCTPLPEILHTLVLGIEDYLGEGICSILLCETTTTKTGQRSGRLRHGAAPHLPDDYNRAIDGLFIGEKAGSCGTAAFCRDVVVVSDIERDPKWKDFKDLALSYGLRACWSAPAIASNGEVVATFAVYYRDRRTPTAHDLEIMTLAADIAKIAIEQSQANASLTKRDRYLSTLVDIQRLLLNAPINYTTYQNILNHLGSIADVDRIYIFENHTDSTGHLLMSQRAEWCADGVEPQIHNSDLQNLRYEDVAPRWLKTLSRGILMSGAVATFPDEERLILEAQGIASLLAIPLIAKDDFFGFIGFDSCTDVREWNDLELGVLTSVATAIAIAKEREQATQALERFNRELEDRVEQRTAALRRSEEQARGTLLAIPDLLFRLDREGRYLDLVLSPRVQNLVEPQQALGRTIDDVLPADLAATLHRLLDQALTTQSVQSEEYKIEINGQLHYEEARVAPCGENEVVFLIRDISARRQAQEALHQNEMRFRRIAANVPGAIYQYVRRADGTHRFLYISDRAHDIFGLDPAEIQADADILFDLVHPEDQDSLATSIAQSIRSLEQWTWEGRIITPADQQKWIQGISIPTQQANGDILADGLVLDISDRKQTEAQLQESEEKYRNLVENANDIIYVLSIDGIFTYVSSNWTEILGHDISEVENHSFIPFVHPEDVPQCLEFLRRLIETGEKQSGVEYRVRHKNGTWRWHTSNASPQRDSSGQITSCLGIGHDITDRKEAAELLQQSNAELARATRLKDEFLANMSHELRTPLNAILGMSEGMREGVFGTLQAPQQRAIATIEKSGRYLLELINDILDLSKIEAGKLILNVEDVSIQSLCNTSLTFVKQSALTKQLTISTRIPEQLGQLRIQVDNRRICQVLINLLSNAVKFTPEGGHISLEVRLDVSHTVDSLPYPMICFAVKDTGIGIASDNLSKLFQAFVQIDSSLSRQYTGTGLGLALVKQIVEMHSGYVEVTSEVGEGSQFFVYLPYTDSLPAGLALHQLPDAPDSCSVSVTKRDQPPRVLLVEDNEANSLTITSYLSVKGYDVLLCKNGLEAIALTKTLRPDLILMDIQMPGMNGLDAIQAIRQDPEFANVPIIALTALAMTGDQERCLNAGADEYLTKPVKLKQLVSVIHNLL